MNTNELQYLKHKIMKKTSKEHIKNFFMLNKEQYIRLKKGSIQKFFIDELKISKDRLEELDIYYKEYYSKFYTKMEDSFKSKYRLFIFAQYLGERVEDFNTFVITNQLIQRFASMYYQGLEIEGVKDFNATECAKYIQEHSTKEHYKSIKDLQDTYISEMATVKNLDAWKEIYSQKSCSYCGVNIDEIQRLRKNLKISSKSGRGFTLEVDRMEPNKEYTVNNCSMSCYWCNNAKTDEFIPSEFKEIAKGIHATWKARGRQIDEFNIIEFEEIKFWKDLK